MKKHASRSAAILREHSPVEAVRRINRRWIVHGGLRETAAAYLEELRQIDPDRLSRSCALAMDLVHGDSGSLDPKPWFYAGLFSMATTEEAQRLLADHQLTRTVWNDLHGVSGDGDVPEGIRALGETIADAIREKTSPAAFAR